MTDEPAPHDSHVELYRRSNFIASPEFALWRKEQQARRATYEGEQAAWQETQPIPHAKPYRLPGQAAKIRALHDAIRQRKRVAVQHRQRGSTAAAEREEETAAVFESILRDVQKQGTT